MKIEHESFILNIEEVLGVGDSLHYRVSCKELPYFPQGLYMTDLNTIITRFKLAVKSQMKAEEVEKAMTQDTEVQLVNQFILDLNQVADEMETVEKNNYYEVILEAKLMKLMKAYGESLCLGTTMNIYRSHYKYVLKQREKKDTRPLTMKFLTTNGKVITVPCSITEDGGIQCEPFKENVTIVGWSHNGRNSR